MLTSLQNPLVKHVYSLQRRKEREESGEFVVEGRRFVEEAIKRGAKVSQIFYCPELARQEWQDIFVKAREQGILIEKVDQRVLRKMSSTEQPQGILAVVKQPDFTWEDIEAGPKTVLLIVDGVQDPGNLGTILRTALAAGIRQVCLTVGTVDLYNSKVLRSTMGAIFSLAVLKERQQAEIIKYCQEHSLELAMADTKGELIYKPGVLQLPLALVIGNEGNGPSEEFAQYIKRRVTIPMNYEVESLNAAMATGILLYEIVRQRDFL